MGEHAEGYCCHEPGLSRLLLEVLGLYSQCLLKPDIQEHGEGRRRRPKLPRQPSLAEGGNE